MGTTHANEQSCPSNEKRELLKDKHKIQSLSLATLRSLMCTSYTYS